MKLEVTPAQLEAIKNLTDDCDSMCGGGELESDKEWRDYIAKIDRMLHKNGHSRYHNNLDE